VICLKLAGCDIVQGYHFSRPMSLEQLYEYAPFINAKDAACVQ
jgi:EAL domain-containing protein (putative c-di-GMP-specific phosphodiesterase class I)